MHEIAEFRSDKCARPTLAMLKAMTDVRWGDGQEDEGETVGALERLATELTGKEAALFAPSGTMANQLAIHAHTRPGDEIVLDGDSHILWTEGGTASILSGVQTCALASRRGMMDLRELARCFERRHKGARTTLVSTENTHNMQGGLVVPLDYLKEVHALASRHGARVHLDGARVINASDRSGIPVADYAATADSLMFCLSKGLCAPVGSVLCGDKDFISRARHFRERIGGMLKQPAPLARCGIIALTTMVDRLTEDHDNASRLAAGLKDVSGIEQHLDIEEPETNMVFMTIRQGDADAFIDELAGQRVRAYHISGGRMRFVTHNDIDAEDVDRTVKVFEKLLPRKDSG